MAIIGFIASLLLCLYVTLVWLLFAADTLGTYNIGGVPNSVVSKLVVLVLGALLYGGWVLLFEHAPFTITVN